MQGKDREKSGSVEQRVNTDCYGCNRHKLLRSKISEEKYWKYLAAAAAAAAQKETMNCLLVELHREGSAPAACAASLFFASL